MKKTIVVFALLLVAFVGKVSAQRYELENVLISSVKMTEGTNTVQIPNGRGTIRFVKRGETFSNVIFQDAAGKIERLSPSDGSVEGAPTIPCKCPVPDACFGTANKNIGMCMCKPCDLSNGQNEWNIGLLLPAVQKVREAASRL
ncbi:hypothetical protein GCM10011514_17170 [Emticicia aquatilis]|uniref:Uncharacterized protein n=1 Tax=Emticicia aquatilis TaxID=1537369 RepID=A0A916YNB2_9BACT|nr:hypothetical protein [Emticicia aquatilis]GGD53599.1 hypothetical protein GCM10011514_17170 [Emticicia aquatilis]